MERHRAAADRGGRRGGIRGEGDRRGIDRLGDYVLHRARGRIVRQTEYWPDPFEAAAWRAQWVERM